MLYGIRLNAWHYEYFECIREAKMKPTFYSKIIDAAEHKMIRSAFLLRLCEKY